MLYELEVAILFCRHIHCFTLKCGVLGVLTPLISCMDKDVLYPKAQLQVKHVSFLCLDNSLCWNENWIFIDTNLKWIGLLLSICNWVCCQVIEEIKTTMNIQALRPTVWRWVIPEIGNLRWPGVGQTGCESSVRKLMNSICQHVKNSAYLLAYLLTQKWNPNN